MGGLEGWRARGWAKELKGVQGFRCACALSLSRPIAGHPPVHTSPFYTKWQGDLLPSGQSVRLKELKSEGPGFDSQGVFCCWWCCCCCCCAGAAAAAAGALLLLLLCW